jgi:hypothetical protein
MASRVSPLRRFCIAADHDGERAADGANFSTAGGRVEHGSAEQAACSQAASGRWRDRAMSIRIVPRCMKAKMPSGPSATRSTSGESGSIVMMRVACRATSPGEDALRAPWVTRSSTGP